jgi:hypothetical protein
MDFSQALTALKSEQKVARAGWNGKGMYLYLVPENRYAPTTPAGHAIAQNNLSLNQGRGDQLRVGPLYCDYKLIRLYRKNII